MGYFDDINNVREYIKMVEGLDGADLVEVLKKFVEKDSTVLELGMGPGKDLDLLSKSYITTGSDSSKVFLELYRSINPDADLLLLDAVMMDTDRKFDCIYSNKVLHHLTTNDLRISFQNQYKRLNESGILFHAFWYGDKEEQHHGLRFVYYTEETVVDLLDDKFELLELNQYKEDEENDSFYIILKKSKSQS